MIKNNKGYTLIEVLIAMSITSILLLVFTNSILNNFRFINSYRQNLVHFNIMRVHSRIKNDLENCTILKNDGNLIDMILPVLEKEGRFIRTRISYRKEKEKLTRTEYGKSRKVKKFDLNQIEIKMNVSQKPDFRNPHAEIELIYILHNNPVYRTRIKNRGLIRT